jgi:hypothetical protein
MPRPDLSSTTLALGRDFFASEAWGKVRDHDVLELYLKVFDRLPLPSPRIISSLAFGMVLLQAHSCASIGDAKPTSLPMLMSLSSAQPAPLCGVAATGRGGRALGLMRCFS